MLFAIFAIFYIIHVVIDKDKDKVDKVICHYTALHIYIYNFLSTYSAILSSRVSNIQLLNVVQCFLVRSIIALCLK